MPIDIASIQLGNRLITINFLIDTVTDTTAITPRDALNHKIDFSKLTKKKNPSIGIDGAQSCEYKINNAEFRFRDITGNPSYSKLDCIDIMEPDLKIQKKKSYMFKIQSLLETYMLHNVKFIYNLHARLELKKISN